MKKELKIRITDRLTVKRQLDHLGAVARGSQQSVHSYFNQPDGKILKLVEANGRVELHRLHMENDLFVLDSIEVVPDNIVQMKDLTSTYGMSKQLHMTNEGYDYHGYSIDYYDISGVGMFLLLSGEQPSPQLLHDWFGITQPDIVRVSFDKL